MGDSRIARRSAIEGGIGSLPDKLIAGGGNT